MESTFYRITEKWQDSPYFICTSTLSRVMMMTMPILNGRREHRTRQVLKKSLQKSKKPCNHSVNVRHAPEDVSKETFARTKNKDRTVCGNIKELNLFVYKKEVIH